MKTPEEIAETVVSGYAVGAKLTERIAKAITDERLKHTEHLNTLRARVKALAHCPRPARGHEGGGMKFYATQGQDHTHRIQGVTIDCDSLVEITADSYAEAHHFAEEIFGGKWCTLYPENDAHFEYYPRGVVLSLFTRPELKPL